MIGLDSPLGAVHSSEVSAWPAPAIRTTSSPEFVVVIDGPATLVPLAVVTEAFTSIGVLDTSA